MAHRNRWFTYVYLLIAWWLSMAMLNNQMDPDGIWNELKWHEDSTDLEISWGHSPFILVTGHLWFHISTSTMKGSASCVRCGMNSSTFFCPTSKSLKFRCWRERVFVDLSVAVENIQPIAEALMRWKGGRFMAKLRSSELRLRQLVPSQTSDVSPVALSCRKNIELA